MRSCATRTALDDAAYRLWQSNRERSVRLWMCACQGSAQTPQRVLDLLSKTLTRRVMPELEYQAKWEPFVIPAGGSRVLGSATARAVSAWFFLGKSKAAPENRVPSRFHTASTLTGRAGLWKASGGFRGVFPTSVVLVGSNVQLGIGVLL